MNDELITSCVLHLGSWVLGLGSFSMSHSSILVLLHAIPRFWQFFPCLRSCVAASGCFDFYPSITSHLAPCHLDPWTPGPPKTSPSTPAKLPRFITLARGRYSEHQPRNPASLPAPSSTCNAKLPSHPKSSTPGFLYLSLLSLFRNIPPNRSPRVVVLAWTFWPWCLVRMFECLDVHSFVCSFVRMFTF